MKVINLFGEPSVGKSTTAAGLFYLMKNRGFSVELVNEYAKECVWESKKKTLNDQLYVTAKQNHKLETLRGQVEYVITDSPLILGILYSRESSRYTHFHPLIQEVFHSYDNLNVLVSRVKPYNPVGRMQNEEEAKMVRVELLYLLDSLGIVCHEMDGDLAAPDKIINLLTKSQV